MIDLSAELKLPLLESEAPARRRHVSRDCRFDNDRPIKPLSQLATPRKFDSSWRICCWLAV
jgi:hypothetical protein